MFDNLSFLETINVKHQEPTVYTAADEAKLLLKSIKQKLLDINESANQG